MALLGAASITGVPAFGFPKINSFVGRIFIPAFIAAPLWSTNANRAIPFAWRIPLSFSTVSSTEWLLRMSISPLPFWAAITISDYLQTAGDCNFAISTGYQDVSVSSFCLRALKPTLAHHGRQAVRSREFAGVTPAFAQRLWYSSWRRHQTPVSLRPLG